MRSFLSLEVLLPIFLVTTFAQHQSSPLSDVQCDYSPVEVVILIDLTTANRTNFKIQQQRVLRTLKHLESVLFTRKQKYSVIGFHANPVTLIELASPYANDTNRVATLIGKLRSKKNAETSVAKALEAAVDQFKTYGEPSARRLVLLAHDGINTDYVAETIAAGSSIHELGIHVFALSGNPSSNFLTLLGYAGDRERLLIEPDDTQGFHDVLEEAVGSCVSRARAVPRKKAKGVRIGRAEGKPRQFEDGQQCGHDKVDLILVLDTSGSVYEIFEEQKKIALDILGSFPAESFSSRLQVSVVRFAATADVLIPFRIGRPKEEMIEEIKTVNFTGQSTKIATAIEIAVDQMDHGRRKDAIQIFVLISDGHGQEYWHVVQQSGKRLQETGAELFAVSAGRDYNNAELLIYVGHKSRLFIGPRYTGFVPSLTSFIGRCVGRPLKSGSAGGSIEKSTEDDGEKKQILEKGTKDRDAFRSTTVITKRLTVSKLSETTTVTTAKTTTTIPVATTTVPTLNFKTVTISGKSVSSTTEGPTTISTAIPVETSTVTLGNTTKGLKTQLSSTIKPGNASTNNLNTSEDVEGSGLGEGSGEEAEIQVNDNISTKMLLPSTFLTAAPRSSSENEVQVSPSLKSLENFRFCDEDATKSSSSSISLLCDVDLIVILDRSTSVTDDFERELAVALRIAKLFTQEDYSSSKIRLGTVSFAQDARLELPLMSHEKAKVLEVLEKIEHTGGSTSVVEGAKLAIARLLSNRRQNARLVILLLTDGHSQDYWRHLIETAVKLRSNPNSILLAYTASNFFSRTELQAWTADKNHIFLDTEQEKLIDALKKSIQICPEAGERQEKKAGGLAKEEKMPETLEKEEKNAEVLASTTEISETTEITAISTMKQEDPPSTTEFSTEETLALEISRETTTIEPLQEINKRKDENLENIVELSAGIGNISQEQLAITNENMTVRTTTAAGTEEVLEELLKDLQINNSTSAVEKFPEDEKRLIDVVGQIITTTRNPLEEPKVHGIKTVEEVDDKDSFKLPQKAGLFGSCLVDLLFVIDVSTSVEAEFQKQLQFAVDLIKRLTVHDFENRLKVGVVLFNHNATLRLKLGEITSRTSLLDTLLSIENRGGSTSLVSGFETAIKEIQERRRPSARQIAVLISDGNSQDLWDDVIKTSNKLRALAVDVYAVTVSKKYMFGELELYAGDKWRVYIDARSRQFLDETEQSLLHCGKTAQTPSKEILPPISESSLCDSTDPVDIILAVDVTSSSENSKFFERRQFAEDLIKSLPSDLFKKRLSVAIMPFDNSTESLTQLGTALSKKDILYELQRLDNSSNSPANFTLLVKGIREELLARRRPSSRVIIVLVAGNSATLGFKAVKHQFEALGQARTEVFAVSAAGDTSEDQKNLYSSTKLDRFVEEVGSAIVKCLERVEEPIIKEELKSHSKPGLIKLRDPENEVKPEVLGEELDPSCNYKKMDLQLILDASTSREDVFEQQRELALSLIEKLPISADGTHVAVGINSFTSTPTLRQTLGLGRDKKMVRNAIFNIAYNGGSTLTAQAVELSVDDLLRGRRKDALQVVILMNDGISQDSWELVMKASRRLRETGAQRFGIALGDQVDLRELELYIGNKSRIYRDGETEKLLNDVVRLLEKDCSSLDPERAVSLPSSLREEWTTVDCAYPNTDLLVLFDNTDKSGNMTDPVVNANRYLLLDVLGSLANTSHVRVSVISFSREPKIELDFTNISERDRIFAKVEAIKAVGGMPSYADAITVGLDMLESRRRSDAKATMIIVGDGMTKDPVAHTIDVSQRIRETPRLSCLAVDSSPRTDIRTLKTFTGRREHVFDYERNALFAEQVKRMARKPNLEKCPQLAFLDAGKRALAARVIQVEETKDETYRTDGLAALPPSAELQLSKEVEEVKRDLSTLDLEASQLAGEKAILPKITSTTVKPTLKPVKTTVSTGPRSLKVRLHTPVFSMKPRTTTTTMTTTTVSTVATTAPDFANIFKTRSTEAPPEKPTTFKPGCLLDVILVLDSSGSVEETFLREKQLAAGIIDLFRIGPDNAKITIIKFAAERKVKTVWSFADPQSRLQIRKALENVPFSSGTTAIHSAILRAVKEYSEKRGARPGKALPIAIIFTDGYGQQSAESEAAILRELIPHTYAVAINHQYPISRQELFRITGNKDRVYTDANIADLHSELNSLTRDCILE